MLRPTLIFLGLAFILFGHAGCRTTTAVVKPKGTVAVTLEAAKKSTSINATVANLVVVTLPPIDPGQAWQISYHDPRFLKQVREIQAGASPDAGPTVSFLALNQGRTRLRFVLLPSATARVADPIDHQELIVTLSY